LQSCFSYLENKDLFIFNAQKKLRYNLKDLQNSLFNNFAKNNIFFDFLLSKSKDN